MDFTTLGFYAIICGCLCAFAPATLRPFIRFGIGAIVGILAATLLPLIKTSMGVY